jgi:Flp pilus assembly protein TadD
LIVAGIAALSPLALRMGAALARQQALHQLNAGQLGSAQRWVGWAAKLASDDWETDLLEAACYRHAKQMYRWRERLQAAESHDAAPQQLDRDRRLGQIQMGTFP